MLRANVWFDFPIKGDYHEFVRFSFLWLFAALVLLPGCTYDTTSCDHLSPHATRTVQKDVSRSDAKSSRTTENLSQTHTRITGKARCTAEQMRKFLKQRHPKINNKYLLLPEIYISEGAKEGIRGDLAFAQALHETGFLKFGGDVLPQQNNFAGLGTTGKGVRGHSFATSQLGVRAQIQHLKAYASTAPLNNPCVDPRFRYVKNRGCAPYIEDLGGKWAFPGYDTKKYASLEDALRHRDSYGDKIRKICEEMEKVK